MKKLQWKVEGMHCKSCETIIMEDLQDTGAVQDIHVSADKGTVHLTYDENKIKETKIKQIIEKEGYKVK